MFSASSAIRVYHCGASALEDSAVYESGEYAEVGNVVHDFMDIAKMQNRNIALEKYANNEHFRDLTKIPVNDLLNDVIGFSTEIAFAINVYTREVRYLGHHLGRKYPKLPEDEGWICGSEDVVGWSVTTNLPVVADYKNGDSVGDVGENLQVGFHALAMHLLFGFDAVEGRIVYTRSPVSEASYIFRDENLEFNSVMARLRIAYDNYIKAKAISAQGQRPPVYPGDHCKYCPRMNSCEKWTGLVKSFMPDLEHIHINSGALTVDKLGELWPKFKQFKNYFEDAYDQVKELVRKEGKIPLRNGKHLTMVPSSREYIDSKKAVSLLRTYGASEEEIEELFRESHFERLSEIKSEPVKKLTKGKKNAT